MPNVSCWLSPRCSVDKRHSALGHSGGLPSVGMEFMLKPCVSKMLSSLDIVIFTRMNEFSRTVKLNFAAHKWNK